MAKYREAVFIVTYTKTKSGIEYLLLKRKLHWSGWEFPKGGIEKGETQRETALRELKEESGLSAINIEEFNFSGKYKYGKKLPDRPGVVGQTYSLWAAEVKKAKVRISEREHEDYTWLGFNDAVKRLTWKDQKEALKMVHEFLSKTNFREFFTSSGNKVLAGKNAENNDELVKKFEGKGNLIMHTVASGSPFCVLLETPTDKDIKEMSAFCASKSQDWRDNKNDVKVSVFTGKDVSKPKGAKAGMWKVKKSKTINVKKREIEKLK